MKLGYLKQHLKECRPYLNLKANNSIENFIYEESMFKNKEELDKFV